MRSKAIIIYYLFVSLSTFALSLTFTNYVLFLQGNHLSFVTIGLVNAIFMFSIFLLEVPTGLVADIFSRKTSLLWGLTAHSIGAFTYYLSHNFQFFIIAEILAALGQCFISGALEAWVKESLEQENYQVDLTKVFIHGSIVRHVSALTGGALGALLALNNIRSVWLYVGILFLLSIPLFYKLLIEKQSINKRSSTNIEQRAKIIILNSWRHGIRNIEVRRLVLMSAGYLFACQAMNMLWSVFTEQNFSSSWRGAWWVIMSLFIILGGVLAKHLNHGGRSDKQIMIVSLMVTGLSLIVATATGNPIIIMIGFLVSEIGRGAYAPANQGYLQKNIPDTERATITSFKSMIEHGAAGLGWLLAGVLSDHLTIGTTWFIYGCLFLGTILLARRLP